MRSWGVFPAAAAIATVTAAMLAAPATAGAATVGAGTPAPAARFTSSPHGVSLGAAFERLAGRAQAGPRMGIVPPRGVNLAKTAKTAKTAASGAVPAVSSCAEPDCNLAYNGGPVQHSPRLYVVFWGPSWQGSTDEQASEHYLMSFFEGLGTNSDAWSQTMSQYTDGSGGPAFTGAVFASYAVDTSAPPAKVTPDDVAAEAAAAAQQFGISNPAGDQVVVVSQSGTCFSDGFAGSSCQPVPAQYCGWHASVAYNSHQLSFTNLPYQLDAGASCGQDFINPGAAGTYDGFSLIGGHEYAESVTDPEPDTGWADTADSISGGEAGDKCAWGGELWGGDDLGGDLTLSTGTFAVQSLWSNAVGGCVMSLAATSTSVSATLNSGGKTGTSLTVPAGTAVRETAALSGPNAAAATGSVTYSVYSDAACTMPVTVGSAEPVATAGTLPGSAAVKLKTPGTYYWEASYSGDSANASSVSMCGGGSAKVRVLAPPAPAIDTVTSRHGVTSATATVSTRSKGELIVAYVAGKGPKRLSQSAVVSARGLKWRLAARSNAGRGDAEVWYARASGKLTRLRVTARDKRRGWPVEITVVAYRNAVAIGRHATRHAGKGKPAGSLTTDRVNTLVFAVGDDWIASAVPTPGSGQRLVQKATDPAHDTYWVQTTRTAVRKAGTRVTISDTRPVKYPYNLVLVEIS